MATALSFGLGSPVFRGGRRAVNPLDKCTIISAYPRDIKETKPTIFPGEFTVPAGKTNGEFSVTVIEPSSWFKETDPDQPPIEIPVGSTQLAESIIIDYCNSLVKAVIGVAQPALFFIPGEHDFEGVKDYKSRDGITFYNLMDRAIGLQKNWFRELVRMADIDWARASGNPMSIMDLSKMAAFELNMKDKPWLSEFKAIHMVNCQACGTMVNPGYPRCAHCGHINDKAKARELGIIDHDQVPSFLKG